MAVIRGGGEDVEIVDGKVWVRAREVESAELESKHVLEEIAHGMAAIVLVALVVRDTLENHFLSRS